MNKRKYKFSNIDLEFHEKNKEVSLIGNQTDFYTYSKCGEIFISIENELFLSCKFCDVNVKVLEIFWNHLLEKHPFISNEIKSETDSKAEVLSSNDTLNILCSTSDQVNLNENENSDEKSSSEEDSISRFIENTKEYSNLKNVEKKEEIPINKFTPTKSDDEKKPDQSIAKGYWQCDICQITMKRGMERKLHEKTHRGVKRLICETCGKGYTSRNRLLDHIRTHTGERPFKCRFCPKTFFSHSSMKSHDKTHIGFKPFKCDYCDHYFKTKYNKQIHEKKHNIGNSSEDKKQNLNICKLCNKTFKCNDYLLLHLKRHEEKLTSPKPFECSFCPSSFISNVNKNAHERLYHKGEYNYKCGFCGKGFLKLNKKRQHEEMHTRVENRYKCDLCECEYARPEGLKKHKIAKHTKESPYKCKICEIHFESIILFREHCKQHNVEEKLHGCDYCEARFDTQMRLNRHVIKMHKSELSTNGDQVKNCLDTIHPNKINDVTL